MSREIFLCAINNILSGTCSEDCSFCTQSIKHHAKIQRYTYKSIEQILDEAKKAKSYGALGYCLVTAGVGLDDKKTEFVAKVAHTIKAQIDGLNLIACNGLANADQLRHLKNSGVDSYNHNLETSQRYYAQICTTHSWEQRYTTCEDVKSVGLTLCTGGIFGMGEQIEDREALLQSIASLKPESTPLNFFIPNIALPIKERTIDRAGAIEVIARASSLLGRDRLLMVAGGREQLFHGYEAEMFDSGANAIVIGDYLTTAGDAPDSDIEKIKKLGYSVATECHAR